MCPKTKLKMDNCAHCLIHPYKSKEFSFAPCQYKSQPFFFEKGTLLFSEKQSLKGIYCIQEGTVMISKTSSNGKDQIIELLSKGTLLGIRSVLCEDQTNLKAKAILPVKGCFLPKKDLFKLLKEKNDFSFFVIKELAHYIKRTDDKIVSMGQKTMHQRVAEILMDMPNYFLTHSNGFIQIKLRREDLANFVGIATESLIRALSYFQDKQWIVMEGKQLKILDLDKLKQFSQGHIVK